MRYFLKAHYKEVLFSIFFFILLKEFVGVETMTAIGLSSTVLVLIHFLRDTASFFPIIELILLLSHMQWILGPYFAYVLDTDHVKYYMSVEESEYMQIVVPAVLLFYLGYLFFYGKIRAKFMRINMELIKFESDQVALGLIFIGLISKFIYPFVPSSLFFVVYLFNGFQFVGLVFLFMKDSRLKWIALSVIYLVQITYTLGNGMFHDILLWSIFLFMYLSYIYKVKLINKVLLFFVGLILSAVIQSVKAEFRSQIWGEGNEVENKAELITGLVEERVEEDAYSDVSFLEYLNIRLNQGWIISRIIFYVPSYEPYAGGETVSEAIEASILPRFLLPNKKGAGGKENFERFTGYELLPNTAMGISILGEGYANYGTDGVWVFMFIWGLFVGGILYLIVNISLTHHSFIFWLPLIFLQAIKAETDLISVLNYLTKSLLLVYILYSFSQRIFGVKL